MLEINEKELFNKLGFKKIKAVHAREDARTTANIFLRKLLNCRCLYTREEFTHNPDNLTDFLLNPSDCGIVENSTDRRNNTTE